MWLASDPPGGPSLTGSLVEGRWGWTAPISARVGAFLKGLLAGYIGTYVLSGGSPSGLNRCQLNVVHSKVPLDEVAGLRFGSGRYTECCEAPQSVCMSSRMVHRGRTEGFPRKPSFFAAVGRIIVPFDQLSMIATEV